MAGPGVSASIAAPKKPNWRGNSGPGRPYDSCWPSRTSVLWRLTPRDYVTLAAWENIAVGLYRAMTLPVQHAGRRRMALTYVARARRTGWAKAGYMELVIAASLEWQLPQVYTASLEYWLPRRPARAGPRKLGEFRWT